MNINDYSGSESPVDYQTGRTAATFAVGVKVEDLKDAAVEEEKRSKVARDTLAAISQEFAEFGKRIEADAKNGIIPAKEAQYAVKYVKKCMELIAKKHAVARDLVIRTEGSKATLEELVKVVKGDYDSEREKLKQFEEFEDGEDVARPAGYPAQETPETGKSQAATMATKATKPIAKHRTRKKTVKKS